MSPRNETVHASPDTARYAVELTLHIGQRSDTRRTDNALLCRILSSCAFGHEGYTLVSGSGGRDEKGAPESSSVITKSYYVDGPDDAEEASHELRGFLSHVFSEMSQQAVLLRLETIDRRKRQVIAIDNRIIDSLCLGELTGAYFVPPSTEES